MRVGELLEKFIIHLSNNSPTLTLIYEGKGGSEGIIREMYKPSY
jgi:hypothetical protein